MAKNPSLSQTAQQVDLDIQKEINKLSGETKRDLQDQYDTWKKTHIKVKEYQDKLKEIKNIINDLKGDLSYTQSIFEKIVHQLQEGNKALQFQETLISKASNIARETLEIRKGETFADGSHIKNLQRKAQFELYNLNILKSSKDLTEEQITDINEQIDRLKSVDGELGKILNNYKSINKDLGFTGQAAGLLGKIFQKLGVKDIGLTEAFKQTHMMGQAAKAAGAEFNAMETFTKVLGGEISSLIGGPIGLLLIAVKEIVEAFKLSDKSTGDLAKDFNITYNEAANVREELIQIGNLSGNVALNARTLQESMVAVGKSLGSNAMLNQQDLETFTELREMAGYTNEELIGIQKLTLATGGNLKDNTKQFLSTVSVLNAQNKLTVNEKQLLKEVANVSAAIKLSIGGTTEQLAKSAFQAKQFGINLDQADRIAENLLDFESSITNELSAELITGKNLNLERARLLALNGHIAEASAEILKQVGGTAEFTKMNRIQQEALAKAVGMSREDLAASLIEREALNKLGLKDGEAAKEKFDLLVKQKGYAAAVAEMGNDQYANQLKQQSIQERFNQSVEKLKEIFISIAEPVMAIISPFVDILAPILSVISGVIGEIGVGLSYMSTLIKGIIIGWTIYKGITLATKVYQAAMLVYGERDLTLQVARNLAKGEELTTQVGIATAAVISNPILSGILGLALAAGVGALIYSSMKDGIIDPSKGPVLSGGFGSVQLNPKDKAMYGADGKIKVGTNLEGKAMYEADGKIKVGTNLEGKSKEKDDTQSLSASELREIKNILRKTLDVDIEIAKGIMASGIGSALAMSFGALGTVIGVNTYKTQ